MSTKNVAKIVSAPVATAPVADTAPVAPVVSVPALATAQTDLSSLIARIVEGNPEAAKALALASLMRPVAVRGSRSAKVSAPVSEADRAVAAANMSAGFRQTIFRALLSALGDETEMLISVSEIAERTSIAAYRVRADLQTIANRLADFEKFPGIGYRVAFVEGKRGTEQTVRFYRETQAA
jgi:hypothetical protein